MIDRLIARLGERAFGFIECCPRLGKGIRKGAAHTHFL